MGVQQLGLRLVLISGIFRSHIFALKFG